MKLSMCIVTLVSSEGPNRIEELFCFLYVALQCFFFFVIKSQFHSCVPVHIFTSVNMLIYKGTIELFTGQHQVLYIEILKLLIGVHCLDSLCVLHQVFLICQCYCD